MPYDRKISFFFNFSGAGNPCDLPDSEAVSWAFGDTDALHEADYEGGFVDRYYPVPGRSSLDVEEAYLAFDGVESVEANEDLLSALVVMSAIGSRRIRVSDDEGIYLLVDAEFTDDIPFFKSSTDGISVSAEGAGPLVPIDDGVSLTDVGYVPPTAVSDLLSKHRVAVVAAPTEPEAGAVQIAIASRNGVDYIGGPVFGSFGGADYVQTEIALRSFAEQQLNGRLDEEIESLVRKHVPAEVWELVGELVSKPDQGHRF